MKGARLLRQIILLAVLWLLNSEGISRSTEAKTLANGRSDQLKDGTRPVISKHPEDKSIKEGKGFSLICTATGKPKPRIIWKKNGHKFMPPPSGISRRRGIRLTSFGTRLRIKNAVTQDSGDYHCVAKNIHGHSASNKARVEVRRKIDPGNEGVKEQPSSADSDSYGNYDDDDDDDDDDNSGTCKSFIGGICSRYISSDSKVFIPHNKTQRHSEESIAFASSILTDYMHSSCTNPLVKALCYSLFAPCAPGKKPTRRLLCREECEVLQSSACSKEFRLLRNSLGSSADDIIPDCSVLSFDAGDCLVIGNTTTPVCRQENSDVPAVTIRPLSKTYPVCKGIDSTPSQSHDKVEIKNKEIFHLLRNVKSEIKNGRMLLHSHSSELFTYCFTSSIPFHKLVREWSFYHKTPLLPNFQRPNNIAVPGLRISTRNSSVDAVLIPLGSAVRYKVHEKVVLRNVEFYYRLQSGHGSFVAKGEFDLCGRTVFKLTVETLHNGTVKISGFSERPLDVGHIESVFVAASPSSFIVDAITKANLFALRLMKPVMEAYITKDLVVKFSGGTYFGDNALPVQLEFFGGMLHRQNVLLAGISSPHLTMNYASMMFTGFSIPYFDFVRNLFSGSVVGITLSANDLDLTRTPYVRFERKPLSHAFADKVPWGLSLVSSGTIPTEVRNSSRVSQLFQAIFGRGSEYTVKATTNWSQVTLNWHFHNVSDINCIIRLPSMEISVDGTFYRTDERSENLPFSGHLTYHNHKSTLEGNFESRADWRKAFGIENLTIRNLRLGVTLPANMSQQSSIRGEADLQLGSNCHATRDNGDTDLTKFPIQQDCVTGHLYLGFSDVSADHFFYGTLPPVSLQKLLEICNIHHKLPGAMATIGFPEGFQISIAKGTHDLKELGGPVLQPGFTLKGKMSLLGIETTGAISLLPKDFLIDAEVLSNEVPVAFDDATPIFSFDRDHGFSPRLFLKARMYPVPFVKAKIDGYARLFGIFEEARMLVTRESLQIFLTTDADKSFKINVHITTNYSSHSNVTQINAMVVFENGLSKLTRMASKQVVAMLEQQMSKLKREKGQVQRLKRECVKTIKRDCSSCSENKVCDSSLVSCISNMALKTPINASERKYDLKRANATPVDVCQQFVMNHCLGNETVCSHVCRFISSKTNKTCAAYEGAATAQRKLERGLRWVKKAEQFMYSDLFQIHAISFKTNVTSTDLEQLYMDTSLEVTIFGQKQKLEGLRMEFNDFVKLASEIAKYAWDWYQKAQPQSKPNPRHHDNRPRSPS